jgi:hypothetical protein
MYSIMNQGTCFDTALPVLAAVEDNCRFADCELLLRHVTNGGDAHMVRTREKSWADDAEHEVVSQGGGRDTVSRMFLDAIGVVLMKT